MQQPQTNGFFQHDIIYDTQDRILYALYFTVRLFVLLVSYMLCVVALFYTIGSIVDIEVTSFFCPTYTKEEVRQHNYENGYAEGDSIFSCWYIDRPRLNYEAMFSLNSDIFTARIDQENLSIGQIITATLYSIITLVLLTKTMWYTYFWLYDVSVAMLSLIKQNEFNPIVTDKLNELAGRSDVKQQSQSNKKRHISSYAGYVMFAKIGSTSFIVKK